MVPAEMRQLVGFGDRSTGRGNIGGEFGASHCNQWGLCGVPVLAKCGNCRSCGMGWCVGSTCIRWGSTSCKGNGRFFVGERVVPYYYYGISHCVATPLQRGLFSELHCASGVRAGPAGLDRGVASRRCLVVTSPSSGGNLRRRHKTAPAETFGATRRCFQITLGRLVFRCRKYLLKVATKGWFSIRTQCTHRTRELALNFTQRSCLRCDACDAF